MISKRHLPAPPARPLGVFTAALAGAVALVMAFSGNADAQSRTKSPGLQSQCRLSVIGAYRAKAKFPRTLRRLRTKLRGFTKGRGFGSFRLIKSQKFTLRGQRWRRVKLAGRYVARIKLVEQLLTSNNVKRLRLLYEVWRKRKTGRKPKRLLSTRIKLTRGGSFPYGGPRLGRTGRLVTFLTCK